MPTQRLQMRKIHGFECGEVVRLNGSLFYSARSALSVRCQETPIKLVIPYFNPLRNIVLICVNQMNALHISRCAKRRGQNLLVGGAGSVPVVQSAKRISRSLRARSSRLNGFNRN